MWPIKYTAVFREQMANYLNISTVEWVRGEEEMRDILQLNIGNHSAPRS